MQSVAEPHLVLAVASHTHPPRRVFSNDSSIEASKASGFPTHMRARAREAEPRGVKMRFASQAKHLVFQMRRDGLCARRAYAQGGFSY
jgi:hypothetical protein